MRALLRFAVATVLVAAPVITVTVTADAADDPTPIVVLTSDFEDGTAQGWAGRAAETVTPGSTVAHGGTGSLAVTGRTAAWQGPSRDVLDVFDKGTSYTISAWVRMAEGSDNARLSAPYTLSVIGSPQTMQTALQIPGGVVASVNSNGGSVTMEQQAEVEVTAVRQAKTLQYARPAS